MLSGNTVGDGMRKTFKPAIMAQLHCIFGVTENVFWSKNWTREWWALNFGVWMSGKG